MKKIIYVALVALLCSCSSGGYTLSGTVEGVMAGDSIALYSFSAPETPIASAEISQDGQINLSGSIAGVDMAVLVLNGQSEMGMLFIESGKIVVAQNDMGALEFTGTPLNDANIAYSSRVTEIEQKFAAVDQTLPDDELQAAQQAIFDEYVALTAATVDENLDNMFGAYLFASGQMRELEPTEALARLAEFSADVQALDFMVDIEASIQAALRTEVGQQYTDITLIDINGQDVSVSSLLAEGKYVLIDFWATWCNPCMAEMPYLRAAYAEFKDKGFEIYGVSLDRDAEAWLDTASDDMPWVCVIDSEAVSASSLYAITTIPANFLISPDGVIVAKGLRGEDVAVILSEYIK